MINRLEVPTEFLDRVDKGQCAAWWKRVLADAPEWEHPYLLAERTAYYIHRKEELANRSGQPYTQRAQRKCRKQVAQ